MSRCLSPVMLSAALAGRTVGPDDRAATPGTLEGQFRLAGAVPVASVDRARRWIARGNRASQAGLVEPLELAPARQVRAQPVATIPMFENGRATAANRIAVLPGKAPGTVGAVPVPERQIPLAPAARDRPAAVFQPRPDVAAVETARIGVQQAEPYSALRRTGSLAGSDTRTGDLSIGAIFQGRQSRTALDEVESALATSTPRERAILVAEDAARDAVLYARGRYRAGLIDVRTLLESERSLPSRRDGRSAATMQLHKGPDGGWPGAPLPATVIRMRATPRLAEPVTRP